MGSLVHGVIVNGRKQGCIKKHFGTSKAESVLCRKQIAEYFQKLFCEHFKNDFIENYQDLKNICCEKSPFWKRADLKEKLFKHQLKHAGKIAKNNFLIKK